MFRLFIWRTLKVINFFIISGIVRDLIIIGLTALITHIIPVYALYFNKLALSIIAGIIISLLIRVTGFSGDELKLKRVESMIQKCQFDKALSRIDKLLMNDPVFIKWAEKFYNCKRVHMLKANCILQMALNCGECDGMVFSDAINNLEKYKEMLPIEDYSYEHIEILTQINQVLFKMVEAEDRHKEKIGNIIKNLECASEIYEKYKINFSNNEAQKLNVSILSQYITVTNIEYSIKNNIELLKKSLGYLEKLLDMADEKTDEYNIYIIFTIAVNEYEYLYQQLHSEEYREKTIWYLQKSIDSLTQVMKEPKLIFAADIYYYMHYSIAQYYDRLFKYLPDRFNKNLIKYHYKKAWLSPSIKNDVILRSCYKHKDCYALLSVSLKYGNLPLENGVRY